MMEHPKKNLLTGAFRCLVFLFGMFFFVYGADVREFILPHEEIPSDWTVLDERKIDLEYLSRMSLIEQDVLRQMGFQEAFRQAFRTPSGLVFVLIELYDPATGSAQRLEVEKEMKQRSGISFNSSIVCGAQAIKTSVANLDKIYFWKAGLFVWIEGQSEEIVNVLAEKICGRLPRPAVQESPFRQPEPETREEIQPERPMVEPEAVHPPQKRSVPAETFREGNRRMGEFQGRTGDWPLWSDVTILWKGKTYRPARFVDEEGLTLYHLWFDSREQVVTDERLISDLYTVLLFLGNPPTEGMRQMADEFRNRSQRYQNDEENYRRLAGSAALFQTLSEGLALYLSFPNPKSYWGGLSLFVSGHNVFEMFSVFWRLWNVPDIGEKDLGRLLNYQRQELVDEVKKIHTYASLGEGIADVGKLYLKHRELTNQLKTAPSFAVAFVKTVKLEKLDPKLWRSARSLGWSFFNFMEDTGDVAKKSLRFFLKNRMAGLLNLKAADILQKTADGSLSNADEILTFTNYLFPMTLELRKSLLEDYKEAYVTRKRSLSGRFYEVYEWLRGVDVAAEADNAIAENEQLLQMQQEFIEQAMVNYALEMYFSLNAMDQKMGKIFK